MNELSDLIRLLAVPIFIWAGWRDFLTRRVKNYLWPAVVLIGLVALSVDLLVSRPGMRSHLLRMFVLSVVSVGGLAVLFARKGYFGWADAGALISISTLFPIAPSYVLGSSFYPVISPEFEIFALTIVANAALIALVTPIYTVLYDANNGHFDLFSSLYSVSLPPSSITTAHGRMFYSGDSGLVRGVDIDVIRMYLRWRQCSFEDAIENPEQCRDPTSIPAETDAPFDGRVRSETIETELEPVTGDSEGVDDPWGLDRFYDEVEAPMYGARKLHFKNSLDQLFLTESDTRVSLGHPFVMYVLLGIIVAILYGNLIFTFI